MRVNVLKKGDTLISATKEYLVIKRRNGDIDLIELVDDSDGLRVNPKPYYTIGYGDGVVEEEFNGVTVTHF